MKKEIPTYAHRCIMEKIKAYNELYDEDVSFDDLKRLYERAGFDGAKLSTYLMILEMRKLLLKRDDGTYAFLYYNNEDDDK